MSIQGVQDVYGIYYGKQLETLFFNKEDANEWLEHILSSWGINGGPLTRGREKYEIVEIEIFESFNAAIQIYQMPT